MEHDYKKYVYDISKAADEISEFVGGISLDEYLENRIIKAAVERKFEIIGEALNRIMKTAPDLLTKIRDHRKIIDFRNLLIHGYDMISDPIVWDIIQESLPVLREDINNLLDDLC